MNLNVCPAKDTYLPQILNIYDCARKFMRKTGNHSQWTGKYPDEETLLDDILKQQLYVIKESERVHAVFAFIIGEDPTYKVIDYGKWLSDKEYGTIHRIASDGEIHGVFEIAVAFCENKISHLRIDTHEDNKVMQHLIAKNGFKRCGTIYLADGAPRIAFEKI